MQRDFFLSTLINDRLRPALALPADFQVTTGEYDGKIYSAGVLAESSMVLLCRDLLDAQPAATHIQFFYTGQPGQRPACIFCNITDTAAVIEEDSHE
jgi:hypothetical protein